MLQKKIVFVVGAGASVEFGFPLGSKLKEEIAAQVKISFDWHQVTSGDSVIAQAAREYAGATEGQLEALINAGEKIAKGMPGAQSIDNFLHSREGDKDINLMGKLGIVKAILAAERSSDLYISTPEELHRRSQSALVLLADNQSSFQSQPNSWLGKLSTLLCQGFHHERLEELFDNVAFIIFNYDRCVETYLWNHLQQYFGLSEQVAAELLEKVQFHHPYGTVGRLPWQRGDGYAVRFGKVPVPRDLIELAKGIKTFTESVHAEAQEKLIGELRAASLVMFLGFGFIEQNMRVLDLKEAGKIERVFATAINMSPDSCEVIDVRIHEAFQMASRGAAGVALNNVRVHPDLTASSIFDYYSHRLGR